MERKITVELTFNWEDYDDVAPELMVEDGIELKEGITYKILNDDHGKEK